MFINSFEGKTHVASLEKGYIIIIIILKLIISIYVTCVCSEYREIQGI